MNFNPAQLAKMLTPEEMSELQNATPADLINMIDEVACDVLAQTAKRLKINTAFVEITHRKEVEQGFGFELRIFGGYPPSQREFHEDAGEGILDLVDAADIPDDLSDKLDGLRMAEIVTGETINGYLRRMLPPQHALLVRISPMSDEGILFSLYDTPNKKHIGNMTLPQLCTQLLTDSTNS